MLTISISDLHVARRSSRLKQLDPLQPLFQMADRVIVNGDMLDYKWVGIRASQAAREQAEAWLAAQDCEVILLAGNHDAHLPERKPCYLLGRACYTHGHLHYHNVQGQSVDSMQSLVEKVHGFCADRRAEYQYETPPLSLRLIEFLVPLLSMRVGRFHHNGRIAEEQIPLFLKLLRAPQIDQLVFGHTHLGGLRQHTLPGGKTLSILNTGAWLVNATPLVTLQQGTGPAELHYLVKRKDGCYLPGARVTKEKVY